MKEQNLISIKNVKTALFSDFGESKMTDTHNSAQLRAQFTLTIVARSKTDMKKEKVIPTVDEKEEEDVVHKLWRSQPNSKDAFSSFSSTSSVLARFGTT